jgi:hypothetical protein
VLLRNQSNDAQNSPFPCGAARRNEPAGAAAAKVQKVPPAE